MNNYKDISPTEFIEECKKGMMTIGRINKIREYDYVRGWEDRNKLQRMFIPFNRADESELIQGYKTNIDRFKDVASDVCLSTSDYCEETLNKAIKLALSNVINKADIIAQKHGFEFTIEDKKKMMKCYPRVAVKHVKENIERIDEQIEQIIDSDIQIKLNLDIKDE